MKTVTCHPLEGPPSFDDPYLPDAGRIEAFVYESDLHILRMHDAEALPGDREPKFILAEPYSVRFEADGVPHRITAPRGMMTDLVSVPRPLRWLIERVGPHLEAAIVHDFLFIAWQDLTDENGRKKEAKRADWLFANRVMVAGMRAAHVPGWMRAVIAFGLSTWFSWRLYRSENPEPRYIRLEMESGYAAGS